MDHPKCSVHQSLNNVSYDTFLIKKYMFKHIYRRNCAAITIHTDTRSTKCIIININIYQQQIAICKVLDAHAHYMQAASRYPNHCNSLAPGGQKKTSRRAWRPCLQSSVVVTRQSTQTDVMEKRRVVTGCKWLTYYVGLLFTSGGFGIFYLVTRREQNFRHL